MSLLSFLRETSAPAVAVEIGATRVSGAHLEWRGGQVVVLAHAAVPLPTGVLAPSLAAANIADQPAAAAALRRVLERLGRPRRIALVVPDVVAKVSLVRFERVPARAQDLDQLVRWQVRKTAPFAIEAAQISYVRGQKAPDGQEFIVSLARRDVVVEYEQLCAGEGAHAGIVDLATFNVANLVLAGASPPSADWLLVNVASDYATIAIFRGPDLIFFRNRAGEADGALTDLVHQSAMYYEDRLGGTGFARVLVSGANVDIDEVRRGFAARLAAPVEPVDLQPLVALTDRAAAGPALVELLAPLVGVVARGREKAA